MARPRWISSRYGIRVQIMFWTSVLLVIAIVGPLELRVSVTADYLQQDLIDRSREVVNDVAANLGGSEYLDEEGIQALLLAEVIRVPSIVELSVFESRPSGPYLLGSTVK